MNQNALEHLKRAKAAMAQKKLEEEEKSRLYFENITSGKSWLFFKIGVFFCLLMSVLLTVDTLTTSKIVHLDPDDYEHERNTYTKQNAVIWVGDEIYTAGYQDFISVDYRSFDIHKSGIFGQSKFLMFTAHTLGDPVRFYSYQRLSVYEWFPWIQIVLLIPFFVFLFKRPNAWFTYTRMMSFVLIFPAALLILFDLLI